MRAKECITPTSRDWTLGGGGDTNDCNRHERGIGKKNKCLKDSKQPGIQGTVAVGILSNGGCVEEYIIENVEASQLKSASTHHGFFQKKKLPEYKAHPYLGGKRCFGEAERLNQHINHLVLS